MADHPSHRIVLERLDLGYHARLYVVAGEGADSVGLFELADIAVPFDEDVREALTALRPRLAEAIAAAPLVIVGAG